MTTAAQPPAHAAAPDLNRVWHGFRLDGKFLDGAPYGNGHIHETFAARSRQPDDSVRRHILQRLNTMVFPDVPRLMANILRITEHIRSQQPLFPGRNPALETLTVVPARDGAPFLTDAAGRAWRSYEFIEKTVTRLAVATPAQAREAAHAYGRFLRYLETLPAPLPQVLLPGFHHTPGRFAELDRALTLDPCNRAVTVKPETKLALAHANLAEILPRLQAAGALPERIVHNDTKPDNILFAAGGNRATAVIDLDTVMPGLSLHDFGDMVRTMACADTSAGMGFLPDFFAALTEGWLGAAAGRFTAAEVEHLPVAGQIITCELGVRFLTDYLLGDVYFRTQRPGHNLDLNYPQ